MLINELIELAGKFRDSGQRSHKFISVCLFTILGAYSQGEEPLHRLEEICYTFAKEEIGAMNN